MTPIQSVRSVPEGGFAVNTPGHQPCVFLDRDGVLNTTDGLVNSVEDLARQLMPDSLRALARLHQAGIPTILVTNQGGVDRGRLTEAENVAIMGLLAARVEEVGGHLDMIYFCPAIEGAPVPEGHVSGRKPEPGMLFQAARDFGPALDLADSYLVGDMTTDIAAGHAAGCGVTTVLVQTGFGGTDGASEIPPLLARPDLDAAVDWILQREAFYSERTA